LALLVSDSEQVIRPGKIDEQVRDIAGHIEIGPAEMFGEALLSQGTEELSQRMSSRDWCSHLSLALDYSGQFLL
jgi:hypothetical protein